MEKTVINTLLEKLSHWLEKALEMLPNFTVAILIVIIFGFLAKLLSALTQRSLKHLHKRKQVQYLLSKIVRWVVLLTGFFIALSILQLDKTVTSLLAGAGVLGLALGFAFQDIASNFISGVLLSFQSPFKIGEIIELKDETMGKVIHSDLRTTVLETFQGQVVTIPNKSIFQNKLVNYSQKGSRRVDLEVGVAYDTDLEKAQKIAKESIDELNTSTQEVEVFYHTFDGSSINFQLRFWIDFKDEVDYLSAKSKAVKKIKDAFAKNNINIPFPIRNVYLQKDQ